VSEGTSAVRAADNLDRPSDEDEILSSFSEKTDSIDSFSSSGGDDNRDDALVSSSKSMEDADGKTETTKEADGECSRKRGGDSLASMFNEKQPVKRSKSAANSSPEDSNGSTRQTDLTSWFQKPTRKDRIMSVDNWGICCRYSFADDCQVITPLRG
jgi:hypothetical protein